MRTDYIIRVIEQFVQALAAIMLRRKEGNYVEAEKQILTAGRYYLRCDFSALLLYSGEQIAEQFKNLDGNLDFERCILCADLINEQALIYEAKGQELAAKWLKTKCLYLYKTAATQADQFQTKEYLEKILVLEEVLKNTRKD